MKKKGFTLSEALIVITILGIIASITIPVLNNTKPDKDQILYRKALQTIQGAMSVMMDSHDLDNCPDLWADSSLDADSFCEAFIKEVNISGQYHCSGNSSYDNPNFVTTDGLRFWGFEGKVFNTSNKKDRDVYVDRNLTNDERNHLANRRGNNYKEPGLKINIQYDGKVGTKPNSTAYEYENKLITSSYVAAK